MNIAYIIILILSIFAAFYSGFYFGYMKRENKAPEKMPIVSSINQTKEFFEQLTTQKKRPEDEEPKGFYE